MCPNLTRVQLSRGKVVIVTVQDFPSDSNPIPWDVMRWNVLYVTNRIGNNQKPTNCQRFHCSFVIVLTVVQGKQIAWCNDDDCY